MNADAWPPAGWIAGDLDSLASVTDQLALSERLMDEAIRVLERAIGDASRALRGACWDSTVPLEYLAEVLHQEDSEQTTRMAMAIIANALIYHSSIAAQYRLPTLENLRDSSNSIRVVQLLMGLARYIERNQLLADFQDSYRSSARIVPRVGKMVVTFLANAAYELSNFGAISMHDLTGRMFQRMITDRKFLATFYTLPNSAALLSELAVARLPTDWSSRKRIADLRIADFACRYRCPPLRFIPKRDRPPSSCGRRRCTPASRHDGTLADRGGHYAGSNPSDGFEPFQRTSRRDIPKDSDLHNAVRRPSGGQRSNVRDRISGSDRQRGDECLVRNRTEADARRPR